MRCVNGVHWPNGGHEQDWPELLKCATPAGGVVILDCNLVRWYHDIRQQAGEDCLIAVRMYPEASWPDGISRHWCDINGADWAAECYRRLAAVPGLLSDPFVCISPCNEPDLAVEGFGGGASDVRHTVTESDYRFIWSWQRDWVRAMRALLRNSPVSRGTGPLAGGHDIPLRPPDYEYTLAGFRALADEADSIWVHGYAQGGWGDVPERDGYWYALRPLRLPGYRERVQHLMPVGGVPDPGGVYCQYLGKTFILAETGTGRHSDVSIAGETLSQFLGIYRAYGATRRFALCAPFIWNSGPEHGGNRIQPNPDLWRGMQGMDRVAAADWPPKGGIVAYDRHQVFDGWQKSLGGQGFNPTDAFGQFRNAHAEIDCGVLVSPYIGYADPSNPFIYAYTTTGIFIVPKGGGQVIFADRESELPPS